MSSCVHCRTADGTAEADAEKALRHATKAAEAAVSRAMQAAAVAGLDYTAPQDMEIDMPRVDKVEHVCSTACPVLSSVHILMLHVALRMSRGAPTFCRQSDVSMSISDIQVDSRQVERRARAAQQSMLQRAHRREKAQADAAHAQMLAAQQVDRQASQRHRHSAGGPATLQQVLTCFRTYTLLASDAAKTCIVSYSNVCGRPDKLCTAVLQASCYIASETINAESRSVLWS